VQVFPLGFDAKFIKMDQMYKLFFLFISALLSTSIQAEQCWQVGGCESLIGWVRIDKYSYDNLGRNTYKNRSKSLFGSESLPNVNEVVKTKRLIKLRQIDWTDLHSVNCHDHDYKKGEIAEVCDSEDAKFDYLGESAVVRVLAYHKVKHLYVLVQVVSYPSEPFKLEKNKSVMDEDI